MHINYTRKSVVKLVCCTDRKIGRKKLLQHENLVINNWGSFKLDESISECDVDPETYLRLVATITRMHSRRMRTAHSSSRGGRGRSGPDPPEFPPWVWAWI